MEILKTIMQQYIIRKIYIKKVSTIYDKLYIEPNKWVHKKHKSF